MRQRISISSVALACLKVRSKQEELVAPGLSERTGLFLPGFLSLAGGEILRKEEFPACAVGHTRAVDLLVVWRCVGDLPREC